MRIRILQLWPLYLVVHGEEGGVIPVGEAEALQEGEELRGAVLHWLPHHLCKPGPTKKVVNQFYFSGGGIRTKKNRNRNTELFRLKEYISMKIKRKEWI